MKKKNKMICISAALVALMFVGCKPTEANYKKAYDAAKAKREQAAVEQMRPATGLLNDEGPQMRIVDGDTVYVTNEMLLEADGSRMKGRYALGVGLFKMDTNAKASAADLAKNGYPDARMGKARGGKYYTLATFSQNLDSIRAASKEFKKKFPDYPFVGLPGAPVIINF